MDSLITAEDQPSRQDGSTEPFAPGTRRSHTKSKNGCSQCKVRRIKCNEVRPTCQHCARREIVCDFSLSPDRRSPTVRESRSRNSSYDRDDHNRPPQEDASPMYEEPQNMSTNTAPVEKLPIDPFLLPNLERSRRTTELSIGDLELLHHFSTVTFATLAEACASANNRELWQVHAVRLGFKHEFLLRAILSVSARHLRSLNPHESAYYDLLASTHQHFALEAAREALTNVDEYNCHAIFTFSCLIVIMTSASLRKQVGSEAHQEILKWFFLLRGCNSVLQLHWDNLAQSFLFPLLEEVRQTETKATHGIKDVDRIMDLLTTCCFASSVADPEASKAYSMAVYELMKTFSQVSILRERGQGLILSCCIWPNTIPQKYLDLLADQQPPALVILAHYAVLLHWADHEWFMRGMAGYLLDTIKASVGEEWQGPLAWPSSVIGSDLM